MSNIVAKHPAKLLGEHWWTGREVRCAVCKVIHFLDEKNVPTMSGIDSATLLGAGGGHVLLRWYGIQCLQCGAVLRLGEFVEAVMRYPAASDPAAKET